MRLSTHADANYYAYPLDIVAEVSETLDVIRVYKLPSSDKDSMGSEFEAFDHRKIHSSSEYHPDLTPECRTTTQPLHVVQPQGPSFKIQGNHIAWEKWTMRLGFNYREGIVMTFHFLVSD